MVSMVRHFTTAPYEEPAQWVGIACAGGRWLRCPLTTRDTTLTDCRACLHTRAFKRVRNLIAHCRLRAVVGAPGVGL